MGKHKKMWKKLKSEIEEERELGRIGAEQAAKRGDYTDAAENKYTAAVANWVLVVMNTLEDGEDI